MPRQKIKKRLSGNWRTFFGCVGVCPCVLCCSWHFVPSGKPLLVERMALWGRGLERGQYVQWAFSKQLEAHLISLKAFARSGRGGGPGVQGAVTVTRCVNVSNLPDSKESNCSTTVGVSSWKRSLGRGS